jgi:hypothetical protein
LGVHGTVKYLLYPLISGTVRIRDLVL